jgi:trk system potassium uptake protein TrkH
VKSTTTIQTVLHLLGSLLLIEGVLLLSPLIVVFLYREYNLVNSFVLPSLLCFLIGFSLKKANKPGAIHYLQSMLVCGIAWVVLSLLGCIPFYLGTKISFLDAYFETISGFTTTGMTMFTNIELLPKSILFWRSLIQWLGGLGILTFFLAITFRSNNAYFQLFSAESHKINSSRPTPSIFKTVVILWSL